jgi:hypothetical protein
MSSRLAWCVALGALGAANLAFADAADAGGATGIRIGEKGRLHLGVSASAGVDSNPNIAPYWLGLARTPGGERANFASVGPSFTVPQWAPHPNKILFNYPPDVFLAVRPSISLLLPTDRLNLNFNGSVNYYEYLGLLNPGYPFIPGTEAYVKELSPWQYNSGYRRLRTLDGQVGGGLDLNPRGAFGLTITGNAIRSIDPGPIIVGSRIARTNFNAGLAGNFRPGGGTMEFSGRLGAYAEIYDPQNGRWFDGEPVPPFHQVFEDPRAIVGAGNPLDVVGLMPASNATVDPSQFHNAGVSAGGRWQWRFLPKTALFVEGNVGSRFYLKFWENPNTTMIPIGALAGIMGNVTSKLGIVASLGFTYPLAFCLDLGDNFSLDRFNASARCGANTGLLNGQNTDATQGGSDLDYALGLAGLSFQTRQYMWWGPELARWQPILSAPTGQIEARYQITPTMNIAGGFRRSVRFVPLYRYVSDNRAYINFTALFFQRLQLNLGASNSVMPHGQLSDRSVGYNAFPFDESVRQAVPFLATADPGRWDNDLLLMAGLDIFILKWLIVGVSNTFNYHYTNARTGSPNQPPGVLNETPFNLSYVRNLTVARVELRY